MNSEDTARAAFLALSFGWGFEPWAGEDGEVGVAVSIDGCDLIVLASDEDVELFKVVADLTDRYGIADEHAWSLLCLGVGR